MAKKRTAPPVKQTTSQPEIDALDTLRTIAHQSFNLQDARRSIHLSSWNTANCEIETRGPILLNAVSDICTVLRRRLARALNGTDVTGVVQATDAVERSIRNLLACPPMEVREYIRGVRDGELTHTILIYQDDTFAKVNELRGLLSITIEAIDRFRPWAELIPNFTPHTTAPKTGKPTSKRGEPDMIKKLSSDQTAYDWSATRWEDYLGVKASTVKGYKTWDAVMAQRAIIRAHKVSRDISLNGGKHKRR
jgi:hypothetical protein